VPAGALAFERWAAGGHGQECIDGRVIYISF